MSKFTQRIKSALANALHYRKFVSACILMLTAVIIAKAQTTLISPTVNNGGFESGATGWTFVQNTSSTTDANMWTIGSTSTPYAGSNAVYITTNATGLPYAYNASTSRTSHMYKDVTFPAGETSINLSFYYKGSGETGWDRLLVYLAPTSLTPTSGSPASNSTSLTGATLLFTQSSFQSSYVQQNITITAAQAGNATSNSTMRLIFTWQNDNSFGTQPPASLDNITLTTSCAPVTTAAVTNLTPTSVTLNWNAMTGATGYQVRYKKTSDPTTVTSWATPTSVSGGSTTSLALSSLTSNTQYDFQVASVGACTIFSNTANFTTPCNSSSLPQTEGFNSSSLPSCWSSTVVNPGSSTTPAITFESSTTHPYGYNPFEGADLVRFNSYSCNSGSQARLVSLPLNTTSLSSVDVTFYWLLDNTNYTSSTYASEGVQVQYSLDGTTWTNAGSFVSRSDGGSTTTANWIQKRITLPSAAAGKGTVYVGFLFTSAWGNDCYMDAATIEKTPTCFPPTGVTISNITSNSATATWTAPSLGTTPIGYQYSISTSNTAPTGAGTAVTSASTNFTGLSGSTTYYVFVRSKCSSTDSSAWTLATTFTTFCSSATLPFLESFGTSGLPSCWTSSEGSTGASYHWVGTSADASHGAGTAASGSGFAYLYVYLASTSYNPYYLTSTPIFLPAKAKLKYYYFLGADGYSTSSDPNPLEVQISTNYGSSWTTLYSHTYANTTFATSSTSSWNQNTIALGSTYAGQNVLIRFKSNSNYGGGTCDQGLDEVSLDLSEPTATNSTQCGAGTPTCSVASTTGVTTPVFKWYTAATGGTALTGQTGSTLSAYSISATTTFYVSEVVSGIESPRTPVTATVYSIPTASISSSTPPTCYNGNNGSATGSGSGGTSPYTYSWNTAPAQSTQIASNLAAGTYILTVTDAHSCRDTESVTLANPSITTLPAVTINPQSQTVCAGSTVKMFAAGTGLGISYQWYIYNGTTFVSLTNGGIYSGVGTDTLTITAPTSVNSGSQYRCVITGTCSPTATTTTATLTVNQVIPSVSVNVNPGTTICAGTSTTFTATPTNGGASPTYAWKVNGFPVGTNSNTYTTSTLTNGSSVTCTITSNATCAYPASATSSPKFMTVNPNVTPAVSVSVNPGTTICAGTSTTFTATPTNGGASPSYVWKKNSSSVGTGSTYTSSTLSNNDVITCTLTSSVTCVTSSTATSTGITMTVNPILVPSVTITPDSPAVCSGNTITFTATTVNPGTTPVYTWKVNGSTQGSNSSTFAYNNFSNGDIVTATLTSNATCVNPANVTSTGYPVTIISRPLPALLITATTDTNICSGTLVTFHTAATNGGSQPQYQWMLNGQNMNGATANVYSLSSLSSGDVISCVLTSNAVCATPNVVSSNQMMFNVEPTTPPNIYISSNKGTVVKPGDSVTFSAVSINGGLTPSFMWMKNGVATGITSSVFKTADIANNDKISAIIFSSNDCATPDSAVSNTLTMNLTTDIRAVETSITNVTLYPNPNSGTFTIQATLPAYASNASYEILNNLGQVVSRGIFETSGKELKKEISLNEVASGSYFIRISAGENRVVKQFTVQR